MMTDDFKIDTKHINNMQKQISEMSTRAIPIAIQQTLTATARHACRYGLDEMFIAVENDPEIQDAYNRGKANERARISQILKL